MSAPQQQPIVYVPQQQQYYPAYAQPVAAPQQQIVYQQQPISAQQQAVPVVSVAPKVVTPQQQPQQQPQAVFYQQTAAQNHQPQPMLVMQPIVPPTINGNWIEARQPAMEPLLVLITNFLFPGLGHLLIGQVSKAIFYMIAFFCLSFVIGIASAFLIGICFIPLLLVYQVIIIADGFIMAQRLQQGYPIMQGECATSSATWFLSAAVSPVFVTGANDAPAEWRHRMFQISGSQQTAHHDDESGRLV